MGFIPPNKSWNIKKKLTHTHTKESRDISGKFKKNKVLEQPFEISMISFLYSQGGGPERVSGLPRDTRQTGDRVGVRIGFPDSLKEMSCQVFLQKRCVWDLLRIAILGLQPW